MPQASVLNEARRKTFLVKMFFLYYHANKTNFHKKGFALGLVLRVRVFGTRKWPINFGEMRVPEGGGGRLIFTDTCTVAVLLIDLLFVSLRSRYL